MSFSYSTQYDSTTTLSDHMPQVCEVEGFGAILTWNMLYQCKSSRHSGFMSYNNGYGYTETKREYIERLERVIQSLCKLVKENKDISIIALQEIPSGADLDYFITQLNERLSAQMPGSGFKADIANVDAIGANMVIFDGSRLQAENTTDKFTNSLSLKVQDGRFQHFHVTNNKGEKLDLTNVHLRWHYPGTDEYRSTLEDLKAIIACDAYSTPGKHNTVIAGDFNLDLNSTWLEATGAIIQAEVDTTLTYKSDLDTQLLETNDGFVIAHHPDNEYA